MVIIHGKQNSCVVDCSDNDLFKNQIDPNRVLAFSQVKIYLGVCLHLPIELWKICFNKKLSIVFELLFAVASIP